MKYWILEYGHSGISDEEIIQFVWNLNLEYIDRNCRCELINCDVMDAEGYSVDIYILFGTDCFIPKRLHEDLYPGYEGTKTPIDENIARQLCFPYLEERAEEMIEAINYDIEGHRSETEADQLYTTIQQLYYIPRLEMWASQKVRSFFEDREKIYLEKNPPEFQEAFRIYTAKTKFLRCSKNYEPYVVEKDGQIVYYGQSRSLFTNPSTELRFFFLKGGSYRIQSHAYANTKIKSVEMRGAGKVSIGSHFFSGCKNLEAFKMDDNIEVEKLEFPFTYFYQCSKLMKIEAPKKFMEIIK